MPEPAKHITIVHSRDAKLSDTLKHIERIINDFSYQVKDLAKELKGNSVEQTSENIWNWIRENIRYKKDKENIEELRRPARIIADGHGDCDCMTILIRSLLKENGIANASKTVAYPEKDAKGNYKRNLLGQYVSGDFSHIYALAFDNNNNTAYTIDCVPEIPYFNYEHKPITKHLITPKDMELHELAGIEDAILEADDFDMHQEEEQELSGYTDEDLEIESDAEYATQIFGRIEISETETDNRITRGELTRRVIIADVSQQLKVLKQDKEHNGAISQATDIDNEIQLFEDVLNSDDFETALIQAAKSESQFKDYFATMVQNLPEYSLNGTDADEIVYLAQIPGDDYESVLLGRLRLFKRIKSGIKKARRKVFGKNGIIKKGINVLKRISPITVAMRGAALTLIKFNFNDIGEKLAIGYMTEQQANADGISSKDWNKFVKSRKKLERKWSKWGGKTSSLKKAVARSKAGKKAGLSGELGAAALATALAAAAPFVTAIKKLFESLKINRNKQNASKNNNSNTPVRQNNNSNTPVRQNNNSNAVVKYDNESSDITFSQAKQHGDSLPVKKTSFIETVKNNKKIWIFGGVGLLAGIIVIWFIVSSNKKNKKDKKSKRRTLNGQRKQRVPVRRRKRRTTTKRKALNGVSTTRKSSPAKKSTKLKALHRKAKAIRAKHPRMKYTTALKKAANS